RLDVDGMERKQGGNHQAAPAESGCALQQQKEEDSVGRVEQDTDVVVAGRFQAEKLTVESMGEPGQRMPVRLIISGESPLDGRPRQALPHMKVTRDIAEVVIVDERVVNHRV